MNNDAGVIEKQPQELSVFLVGGIIVLPQIFSWFLLRKGYSTKVRLISFSWMIIWLLAYNAYGDITPEERAAMAEKHEARIAEKQMAKEAEANSNDGLKRRIMSSWEGAIKEVLIDPDSAKFEDVVYVMSDKGVPYACGKVNSKNSFGGYTGFKRFMTNGLKEDAFLEGEAKGFNYGWNAVCAKGKHL